jgi:hypothetical protein
MASAPRIDLALLAALGLTLGAARAGAVAPCFDVCHLGQGQPLLLGDTDELWVRRCTTVRSGATPACVLERTDADGRVLETAPPVVGFDDDDFEAAHLRGHRVVRFGYQTAWTDLRRPYKLEPYDARGSLLRIDRDALVCAPLKAVALPVRRPLGCAPRSVSVFAASIGRDGKPEDPTGLAVVVAVCADGRGTREVVATCRPSK